MRELSRSARRTVAGGVAVAVLAAAALLASLAFAHNKAFSNQVTLAKAVQYAPNVASYEGHVNSPRGNCERHREVQVFNVSANPDVRVARTHTTPGGFWKVKGSLVPNGDKVQALIETKVLPAPPGHNHSCNVDRSPTVAFPHP